MLEDLADQQDPRILRDADVTVAIDVRVAAGRDVTTGMGARAGATGGMPGLGLLT